MHTSSTTTTDKARNSGGRVIRHARETIGLTQAQLADLSGVSTKQIGHMERGDVPLVALGQHCPLCGGDNGYGETDDLSRVNETLVRHAVCGIDRRVDSDAIS